MLLPSRMVEILWPCKHITTVWGDVYNTYTVLIEEWVVVLVGRLVVR